MAEEQKKPMVVDFAVPENCSRCEFLEKNVYSRDDIVNKINADFIPIWVDLSGAMTVEEAKLGEAFDYRSDCLLLFLNHEGKIIKDPEGGELCFADEVEPEVFMRYLDHARENYRPAN